MGGYRANSKTTLWGRICWFLWGRFEDWLRCLNLRFLSPGSIHLGMFRITFWRTPTWLAGRIENLPSSFSRYNDLLTAMSMSTIILLLRYVDVADKTGCPTWPPISIRGNKYYDIDSLLLANAEYLCAPVYPAWIQVFLISFTNPTTELSFLLQHWRTYDGEEYSNKIRLEIKSRESENRHFTSNSLIKSEGALWVGLQPAVGDTDHSCMNISDSNNQCSTNVITVQPNRGWTRRAT